ncbi:MAG: RluA family pseudouridine synthase [Planctomycetota bacterium]
MTDSDFSSPAPAPDRDPDADARYEATTLEELEEAGAEHRVYELGNDSKQRLDVYLHNRLKGISRNQIQKLINLGGVTVNGKNVKPSLSLRQGDRVEVMVPPKPAIDVLPEPIPLHILYEDDDMVVVNKQANFIVHPARKYKSGTMVNALAHHLEHGPAPGTVIAKSDQDTDKVTRSKLSPLGKEDQRPGVVHRLDMNTTGVIIFAKQETTHWLLAKQFEDRTNLKCYLALVHGCPEPMSGAINEPLGKHPTIREGHAVRHDGAGKESLTFYRVRRRYRGFSLIECELKSGRTHQIRVHLSYLGFPIVGDQLYGGETIGPPELAEPPVAAGARPNLNFARTKAEGQKIEARAAERAGSGELVMGTPALHAALLRIDHPVSQEAMTFTAPLHSPMLDVVRELETNHRPDDGQVEGVTDGTHIDLSQALPGVDLS